MRIGHFRHWSQPSYRFVDFLRGEGIGVEEIDHTKRGYLEGFEVALVEQNGFDDYVENDELYIRDWVARGGILLFMHQDYRRWAPCFLPEELGYVQLIHRHVATIDGPGPGRDPYMSYLMPWIEPAGRGLFSVPERITPDELIDWRVRTDTFGLVSEEEGGAKGRTVRTAALSCYEADAGWEVLGSYMDPAVRHGALILRRRHGRGMYFLNQLLFPEEALPESERCLGFWRKYVRNLLAYFERFRAGVPEPCGEEEPRTLPVKRNYRMSVHMHSLDWYGCDSAPGTINALLRLLGVDICALAVKDRTQVGGDFSAEKYSDGHVLFLDGQEYHPFNWNDRFAAAGHNNYHMLAIGIDPDAYTPEFTRSLFSDEEVDSYLRRAIRHIHDHHGAVCTAHPWTDYWRDYDYDAVDIEPLQPLAGSAIERHWLSGGRIAILDSVDLFGMRRMFDNPAVNFVYLQGKPPCRDSIVEAVRLHHTIAGAWFRSADITLAGRLPGDVVPAGEAAAGTVSVRAEIAEGLIREMRVYSGEDVLFRASPGTASVGMEFPLSGRRLDRYVRVEVEGEERTRILVSTPFFLG